MSNEDLIISYHAGNKQALGQLMEQNQGIIYRLVNRFRILNNKSIDLEDLRQEGCIGLMIAADKYVSDYEVKAKFITYAIHWINQRLYRYFKNNHKGDESSLNITVGEDGSTELIDYIEGVDYSFENVEEQLYREQLREALEQAMDETTTLSEREILKLHYGWPSGSILSLADVGATVGLPLVDTRNAEQRAMRKIRNSNWFRTEARLRYREIKRHEYNFKFADTMTPGSTRKSRKRMK